MLFNEFSENIMFLLYDENNVVKYIDNNIYIYVNDNNIDVGNYKKANILLYRLV